MTKQAGEAGTPGAAAAAASVPVEEVSPDLTRINAYARAKQTVARDVHYLRELLHQRKSEGREERCRALMAKLAEDHFTLAVLGQFKRGKSSLMNVIIGRPLLPTGVLPLTSAITVLRFGPRERLRIEKEGSTVVEDAPLSSLSDYVTERGNPGNRKRIARAIIEIPSPFLRRGLEFVDTPGVGSAIEANTSITHQFLPQCDAVIFITSVDSPLSQTEMEFLSQIREHVRKIFFVVNKVDLLGEDEREEVLGFITRKLQSAMNTVSVRLFPLSCRDGLDAKARGDLDGYARSGVKGFEETLSEFLSTEKMSAFLVSILDRAIAVADEELRDLELQVRASNVSAEEAKSNRLALQQRLEQLRASRERDLAAVQERIHAFVEKHAGNELRALAERETEAMRQSLANATARHRWRLADGVARALREESTQRLGDSLHACATGMVKHLWPLFEDAVRQEMLPLVARLQEIPQAAAEVLRLDAAPLAAPDEPAGLDLEHVLRAPSPARILPRRELEWQSGIPARFIFFPVSWVRSALARYCEQEHKRMLETAATAIRDAMLRDTDNALERATDWFRRQAGQVEGRVRAAVMGRAPAAAGPQDGESLAKQVEQLTLLRERMSALRDRIIQAQAPESEGVGLLPALVEPDVPEGDISAPMPAPSPSRALGDAEIARDLKTRGCPACDRTHKAVFDFFACWQYELYRDEASQSLFAAEGGLCRLHTWQLAAIASPRGLCQGYPRLLDRLAGEIARVAGEEDRQAESVLSLLPDARSCRACRVVRAAEAAYVERLSAFLRSAEGVAAYRRSQGLCLRHLALLLESDLPAEVRQALLRHTSRVLSSTSEDMQSFFLKRDSLRSALVNPDDEDAYLRALVRLAGIRHLAAPWNPDEGEI